MNTLKCLFLSISLVFNSCSQVKNEKYSAQTVFKTSGVIWGFDFISKNEIIVSLRHGKLLYVNLTTNNSKELKIPEIEVIGQGGLLDVHYKKLNNKSYIYLTHSMNYQGKLTTALSRGSYENGKVETYNTLFIANVKGLSGHHFGSRLTFTEDYIFMTVGDRGERDFAQDLSYHNGKILRLDYDGKAAKGNPYEVNLNALKEIWTYGHRNPQGIDIDPITGNIISCEFGPRGGDELNLITKGKNYGWPVITYGAEYSGESIGQTHHTDMEQPITYWTPSISPSGMIFYTGDKLPKWKNSLFLANLSSRHLRRIVIEENKVVKQEVLFENLHERIRHVRTGLDGYLYFSTDSGKLMRVSKKIKTK